MKRAFIPKNFRPSVPGGALKTIDLPPYKTCSQATSKNSIIILSSKEDLVANRVYSEMNRSEPVIHLYFDQLGYTWDFSFTNGQLVFLNDQIKITPVSIYHRHPGVDKNHPYFHKHLALFEVMDIWKGNSIGQKRDHFQNMSKAFQAIHSLAKKQYPNVSLPQTYLFKGDASKFFKTNREELICKSCSSMRSIAATESDFKKWDKKHLKNLPTLFQEKITGTDYRVHLLDGTSWPLAVSSKDHIDYRYSSKRALKYTVPDLPKSVLEFCKNLSKTENNRFIGVDFVKQENEYFCLESNPGPGWSTFNHPSRNQFTNFFINTLKETKETIS